VWLDSLDPEALTSPDSDGADLRSIGEALRAVAADRSAAGLELADADTLEVAVLVADRATGSAEAEAQNRSCDPGEQELHARDVSPGLAAGGGGLAG
jgi:hypothetical protein